MSVVPSRIVDAHQHVFWHGRDDAGLVRDMDEQRIDCAWLLTWDTPPFEDRPDNHFALNPIHRRPDGSHPGIPLSDLLLARERHPERFALGYCPHPAVGNATELLRAAARIYDLQICGEWKCRMLLDDPRSVELFHVAGELRLPVVLHLEAPFINGFEGRKSYQPNWYGGTVENLERTLLACPDTTFIGHGPGFWRELGADADTDFSMYPVGRVREPGKLYRLFSQHPNLYADLSAMSGLSALQRDPEHAVKFITMFAERLLFGRDFYGHELHTFLQTLALAPDVIKSIYHANAEKVTKQTGSGSRQMSGQG